MKVSMLRRYLGAPPQRNLLRSWYRYAWMFFSYLGLSPSWVRPPVTKINMQLLRSELTKWNQRLDMLQSREKMHLSTTHSENILRRSWNGCVNPWTSHTVAWLMLTWDLQGPTIYPILFSALMSRSLKNVGRFVAERGIQLSVRIHVSKYLKPMWILMLSQAPLPPDEFNNDLWSYDQPRSFTRLLVYSHAIRAMGMLARWRPIESSLSTSV